MLKLIIEILQGILDLIGPGETIIFEITLYFPDKSTITGVINKMELKEGQIRKGRLTPKTARGNPARIEPGSVRVSSSDESVVSITKNPKNELEFEIAGLDGSNNETVTIEVRADGIPGEGVREIVGAVAVTCTQGDAAVFDLEFGDPIDVGNGEAPAPAGNVPGDGLPDVPAEPGPADNAPAGDAASSAGTETETGDGSEAGNEDVPADEKNPETEGTAGDAAGLEDTAEDVADATGKAEAAEDAGGPVDENPDGSVAGEHVE